MKRQEDRQQRLVRLRSVEHRLAQARLAAATGELDTLVRLAERLDRLRADLVAAHGELAGHQLNAIGELGCRLETARDTLSRPIDEAGLARDLRHEQSRHAAAREDNTIRIVDRNDRARAADREMRRNASLPRSRPRLHLVEGDVE